MTGERSIGYTYVRPDGAAAILNDIAFHLQKGICERKLYPGWSQSHLGPGIGTEGELGKEKSARASASGCFTEAAVRILE